ncbi:hypothetical protein A2773_04170 [Candidatus Gottesmanbacteria bacterium RIFCSPHIGHO2_01_FULL_39_10]|uniref:Uncharacterized protein n=1 Tax=Candidatus Gottesmanbacteria bacterium RIFCSPHIGHO2_01_FULL_39_10 TaxID=1798375 RepID=A0A1F5ZRD7_9BACT|nr:MAG: hypothetical protein A2773_04170 [Candidatus Gottesmanbacteria bacterium RIFCSPHIGHO2_01_FULL_39_10]
MPIVFHFTVPQDVEKTLADQAELQETGLPGISAFVTEFAPGRHYGNVKATLYERREGDNSRPIWTTDPLLIDKHSAQIEIKNPHIEGTARRTLETEIK